MSYLCDCSQLRGYLAHIAKHADSYATMGPGQQRVVLENDLISVSPARDQLGRRLSIIRFGEHDNLIT